jgi:preprotein translocase subunit SecG
MSQNELMKTVRGHADFLVYAIVAVVILVIGIVLVGSPEEAGIAFTTLSDTQASPWGSILTAVGGWLIFTFLVSYMIHRRGERETSTEIRATTYLLASFLTELDKAEIETYQAFAALNKSMMISVMGEILVAQGTDEGKTKECNKRLSRTLDGEIEEFGNKAIGILTRSEDRMKRKFDPEWVDKIAMEGA